MALGTAEGPAASIRAVEAPASQRFHPLSERKSTRTSCLCDILVDQPVTFRQTVPSMRFGTHRAALRDAVPHRSAGTGAARPERVPAPPAPACHHAGVGRSVIFI